MFGLLRCTAYVQQTRAFLARAETTDLDEVLMTGCCIYRNLRLLVAEIVVALYKFILRRRTLITVIDRQNCVEAGAAQTYGYLGCACCGIEIPDIRAGPAGFAPGWAV